jgi:hypothetical protein
MKTNNFEAVKIAMTQNRSGYVLTLSVHPDEVPEDILRDFVGARYQVVMVRLNGQEEPMNRDHEYARDIVRSAGMLCRDPLFQKFLVEAGQTFIEGEQAAREWMLEEFHITSRSELKNNPEAARQYMSVHQEYLAWKQSV